LSLLRKQFSTCWTIGARVIEDDVEERGVKMLNMLKLCTERSCGALQLDKASAWDARVDMARVESGRENFFWIKLWHLACYDWLLGFLSFLYFGLNYFIANYFFIFFIFLPKFVIFFSLQIETWIIWFGHRKKTKFFTLLILLLAFLVKF